MKPQDVTTYIGQFPECTQLRLNELRSMIKALAPDALECISYGMPAYKLKGKTFVYFAAYDKHIGVYATPVTHEKFMHQLKDYTQGKGSVQFPLNQEFPLSLIRSMVLFKLEHL